MEQSISPITKEINYITDQQLKSDCTKALLVLIKNQVESLEKSSQDSLSAVAGGTFINVKTREEWSKIRCSLPRAKWNREVDSNAKNIKYTYTFGMVFLQVTVGELPPSCKVIEEDVFVPEQIVPARIEKKRKIVCNKGKDDVDDLFIENPQYEIPKTDDIPF